MGAAGIGVGVRGRGAWGGMGAMGGATGAKASGAGIDVADNMPVLIEAGGGAGNGPAAKAGGIARGAGAGPGV